MEFRAARLSETVGCDMSKRGKEDSMAHNVRMQFEKNGSQNPKKTQESPVQIGLLQRKYTSRA